VNHIFRLSEFSKPEPVVAPPGAINNHSLWDLHVVGKRNIVSEKAVLSVG
jgi:hypothetical protein